MLEDIVPAGNIDLAFIMCLLRQLSTPMTGSGDSVLHHMNKYDELPGFEGILSV